MLQLAFLRESTPIATSIHGDLNKLKSSQVKALEKLTKRRVGRGAILTQEFATRMTLLSEELRRVVAVLIDRSGHVTDVMVGDSDRVYLPDVGRQRASDRRFRGLRLVRTNLRGDRSSVELSREDLSDMSLLQLDVVATVAVAAGGYPGAVSWAHLIPPNPEGDLWLIHHAPNPSELESEVEFGAFIGELESEYQRKASGLRITGATPAMLVYVSTSARERAEEVEIEELHELCRTAGVEVVDTMIQRRDRLHPKYAVGRGKIEDLTQQALQQQVDLLIFGQDLEPGQMRAITGETDLRVIDRTQLILDIFAQHATTSDGKLQVELAQLRYNLPRLSDKSVGMSRLTGGIGGRGPGETKLEINRRRARDRIRRLEGQIDKLSTQRDLRRKKRQRSDTPIVSIVGYTNAGKSTLLNALTRSEVLSEDKLFATLRPTSRRLERPDGRTLILTDTVGFIHDLPPDLVNAFKATLEELGDADLLIHLVDASDDEFEQRIGAVDRILDDLELSEKPRQIVFNKCDRIPETVAFALERRFGAVAISALKKQGLSELVETIERRLFESERRPSNQKKTQ